MNKFSILCFFFWNCCILESHISAGNIYTEGPTNVRGYPKTPEDICWNRIVDETAAQRLPDQPELEDPNESIVAYRIPSVLVPTSYFETLSQSITKTTTGVRLECKFQLTKEGVKWNDYNLNLYKKIGGVGPLFRLHAELNKSSAYYQMKLKDCKLGKLTEHLLLVDSKVESSYKYDCEWTFGEKGTQFRLCESVCMNDYRNLIHDRLAYAFWGGDNFYYTFYDKACGDNYANDMMNTTMCSGKIAESNSIITITYNLNLDDGLNLFNETFEGVENLSIVMIQDSLVTMGLQNPKKPEWDINGNVSWCRSEYYPYDEPLVYLCNFTKDEILRTHFEMLASTDTTFGKGSTSIITICIAILSVIILVAKVVGVAYVIKKYIEKLAAGGPKPSDNNLELQGQSQSQS